LLPGSSGLAQQAKSYGRRWWPLWSFLLLFLLPASGGLRFGCTLELLLLSGEELRSLLLALLSGDEQ
jgi:hypothetical protein